MLRASPSRDKEHIAGLVHLGRMPNATGDQPSPTVAQFNHTFPILPLQKQINRAG